MSEHTNETTIANQAETIRRLIAERDDWKEQADSYRDALRRQLDAVQELRKLLEQKGGV